MKLLSITFIRFHKFLYLKEIALIYTSTYKRISTGITFLKQELPESKFCDKLFLFDFALALYVEINGSHSTNDFI